MTAIGLYAGLRRDARQLKEFNQTTYELDNIDPGTSMVVNLTNGDTVSGAFLRMDRIAAEDYGVKYEKYRQSVLREIKLPQLNDSLGINSKAFYRFRFQGFDFGYMKVKKLLDNTITKMDFRDIVLICKSGNNCIEGENLRRILARGEAPLLSDLILKSGTTEVRIPSEKLSQGKIIEKYYGWLTGLSTGLAADALFVIFVMLPYTDISGVGDWGN